MMEGYRFGYRKRGEYIETTGIDFSGKLTERHSAGQFRLLHKASGTCWNGRGMGRVYVPAEMMIVELEPGDEWARIVETGIKPPRNAVDKVGLNMRVDDLAKAKP